MEIEARDDDPFTEALLEWFGAYGRHDLPWQFEQTPYRVWVSEIMLQQTQVQTVIGYYERFMAELPSVTALANANVDDVLRLWSGLGYYARGRNLHKAAQLIEREHGGQLPTDLEQLIALPGIGRSTAGAILALSGHQRHPILDGNVKRVLCRYHAVAGWPGTRDVEKALWELAESHTPSGQFVAAYTQAIMDLGATVCTRAKPTCLVCPMVQTCAAHREGRVDALPERKPKREIPHRSTFFLILRNRAGEVLLERRPPTGIWGGLWSFPQCDTDEEVERWLASFGIANRRRDEWAAIEHGFSHYRLTIRPLILDGADATGVADRETLWYKPGSAALPVGVAAPMTRLFEALQQNESHPHGKNDAENG
ncbi:MAG: A/G-specific adenine glycosylase [Gammaproteobacteria bacterium]|nr:A/G-specific adenine glycosylase [Gammaproteobacteria bacterium]